MCQNEMNIVSLLRVGQRNNISRPNNNYKNRYNYETKNTNLIVYGFHSDSHDGV